MKYLHIYSPKHFHPHSLTVKLKLLPIRITVHVIVFQPAVAKTEFIDCKNTYATKMNAERKLLDKNVSKIHQLTAQ